jgi:V/A-type H+-transporting ATPase subunit B
MKDGIGEGLTRDDHKAVSDQCYAAYAEGCDLRGLVAIVGKEALSVRDRAFLDFSDEFEDKLVRQGRNEDRTIFETLDMFWGLLANLPETALTRIDRKLIAKYHPAHKDKKDEPAEEKKEEPAEA